MRILGFSKKWDKLNKSWYERDYHTFTTFRYPRRDSDWEVEEVVQVVYEPRSKEREFLGIARIIRKQPKDLDKRFRYYTGGWLEPNTPDTITPVEAEDDGFTGIHGGGDLAKMRQFFIDTYGYSKCKEPMNKLTLYWVKEE